MDFIYSSNHSLTLTYSSDLVASCLVHHAVFVMKDRYLSMLYQNLEFGVVTGASPAALAS